jgi:uncharacterized protein YfaS (alpha-2-macroglobulin family)
MKRFLLFFTLFVSFSSAIFAKTTQVAIDKFYTKSYGDNIYICLNFNKYFDEYRAKVLKPYIDVSPKVDFSLTLDYRDICIGNLEPNRSYKVTVNKDLPLGKDYKLDKSYTKELNTTDYAPSFKFKESGYILPQKGDISIPIEVRNIDKLSISLYRINSRNLIDAINSYGLVRALEYYDLNHIEDETGYKLWQKNITLKSPKNIKKVWAIDVGKYLKKRENGVYILAATTYNKDGTPNIYRTKSQWFMISDIGLFTLEDSSGLHIYTKHLSNATIYDDIKIDLVAKNNEILATTTTKNGVAHFKKALLKGTGGLRAQAIYAYSKSGDFSVLSLEHPSLNLSDRGVGGRAVPKDYDAFVYSNRSIFRPGESVPFHVIIKDINSKSAKNLKVVAKLFDSQQNKIASKLLTTDNFGYTNSNFKLSKEAQTGRYKVVLFASSNKPIGSIKFLVEDFVPPKIEVNIVKKPQAIIPNQKAKIEAKVNFLTGEPLKGAEADIQRVIHRAKNPFKEFKGYHFGKVDAKFGNEYLEPITTSSNEDGKIIEDISENKRYDTSLPLSMFVTLSVNEPGARAVTNSYDIFYQNSDEYIGIKPNFDDDYIDIDAKANFNILYLKNQKPKSATLKYKLIEEECDYSWSYENDSWQYNVDYSDIRVVKKGAINTTQSPATLQLDKLDWGSYRLVVYNDNDTISSYRFSSGYWGNGGKQTPDKLPLSINKKSFAPDDKIEVNIKPKFSGPVMINIANQKIFKTITIDAKEGKESKVEFKIDSNWGNSVYILATAFRAQSKTMGASRAIGVAHFSIVDPNKIIKVQLKHPKKIKAKSKLNVELSTTSKDKEIYFTLSAVDIGVLNITKYKLPNPIKHFFGQLKLGVDIRDIYGDLIKAQGEHAKFDEGAGDDFEELQDEHTSNKREVVAFMSKKLKFQNGKAKVEFNIPNYQGALKLNAVAWSQNGFGQASSKVVVKDPVSIELYMPKYLAIGDNAELTLRVDFDKNETSGKYSIKINKQNLDIPLLKIDVDTDKSRTITRKLKVKALKAKEANIDIDIFKDGKKIASREFKLALMHPYPKSFTRVYNILKADKTLNPKEIIKKDAISASVVVSNKPILPKESIEDELTKYPFRCAEQTPSRAFPFIGSKDKDKQEIVKGAIERLEALQRFRGGFGLWSESNVDLWVSAYAMDFLTRAQKQGYYVSKDAIEIGLSFLENSINRWAKTKAEQEANIYALYVLARNNKILMSDIMHFANSQDSKIGSAIAWGQLAVTLNSLGEKNLAKKLFNIAKNSLNSQDYFVNYGGKFRDKAALVVLLKEANYIKDATTLLLDLAKNIDKKRYLSTQEMSQILRAANSIDIKLGNLKLKIGQKLYSSNKAYYLKSSNIDKFKIIKNISGNNLWYSISYLGYPDINSLANFENRGFKIDKQIYTLKGSLVDLKEVAQGDRYVVVISGELTDSAVTKPLITDMLPAGFEIENPNIIGIDNTKDLKWLKNTTVGIHKEYRDDRFSVYFEDTIKFKFAYIVRATTLGKYTVAPVKIEDMYKPRYIAFSKPSVDKLIVKEEIQNSSNTSENNATNSVSDKLNENDYKSAALSPIGALDKYSIYQLNYLRNGIFAYVGLDFSQSNPALYKIFEKFSWYKPTTTSGAVAYSSLNSIQKENVQKLLKEEKKRLGGVTLADIYRVNIKELDEKFLQNYNKEQLRVLRNSLIARNGYKFKDEKLFKIFKQLSWYKPDESVTTSEAIDKKMNELQRANLFKILKVEKQK